LSDRPTIELIRPDDLVNLEVEGINLRIDRHPAAVPALVVDDAAQPAWLAVRFPPQSVGETAWFEASNVEADTGNAQPRQADALDAAAPPDVITPPLDSLGLVPFQADRELNGAIGHGSRLVFAFPAGTRIPLDSASLLDWSRLAPSVSATAAVSPGSTAPNPQPEIQEPAETETAIELPYRLVISPNTGATWKSRGRPFSSRGRTELWHTRLVLPEGGETAELWQAGPAPLRAIWSPDYPQAAAAGSFPNLGRTPLTGDDRRQIVILTSAFTGWESTSTGPAGSVADMLGALSRFEAPLRRAYVPKPFEADLLMLSSLGGWLRSRGEWAPPHSASPSRPSRFASDAVLRALFAAAAPTATVLAPAGKVRIAALGREDAESPVSAAAKPERLDLSEWVHVAAQGRDHYVRIVYEGRLLPFGHLASLVKVTERRFEEVNGVVGAYLIQHMYVVVRQPVREFDSGDRAMPLKRVQVTTLVTPDIAEPLPHGTKSFWIEVLSGSSRIPFQFHCIGTDVGGNAGDFTIPMMFVSEAVADQSAVAAEYNSPTQLAAGTSRDASVPGQRIMFAESSGGSDNTRLVADALSFVVDPETAAIPALLYADVHVPQVKELVGTDAASRICLADGYLAKVADAGAGVFAEIVQPAATALNSASLARDTLGVEFQAQKAGGFATPNLGVSTLSSAYGPLAGTADSAFSNTFDPSSFFGGLSAQLFGTFDLKDIVAAGSLGDNAPKLTTSSQTDGAGGTVVETAFDWAPGVNPTKLSLGPATFTPNTAGSSGFTVHGLIRRHVGAAGDPTSSFTGKLTGFDVQIVDAIAVHFASFSFAGVSGAKQNVSVQLAEKPMSFIGDLQFVNDLADQLPPGLFSDGPSLDLIDNPAGIRAGFAFALPPLSVGVFALKDVALDAAVTLPFTEGKPAFDFSVSRRDHPFLLAVAIFGGGGFFHLQCDTAGMKQLEAALEFGAAASIDIGVASGGVHIMAGIYFSLQRADTATGSTLAATLSGYLRMGGSLSVLGIVTVSIEFNLSFTYDGARHKAYGRATLTIEIEVACFSKSVDLTVERAFGGQGDPTFNQLITKPAIWSEYALAFA
jgi:hypothetical protein